MHAVRSQIKVCWFAAFGTMEHDDPVGSCNGDLVRCHLIPKPMIRRAKGNPMDRRSWVWGCGGPMGNAGHHGMFDYSRTLRLPRNAIPAATEELALELGLSWWLDKTYGERS